MELGGRKQLKAPILLQQILTLEDELKGQRRQTGINKRCHHGLEVRQSPDGRNALHLSFPYPFLGSADSNKMSLMTIPVPDSIYCTCTN